MAYYKNIIPKILLAEGGLSKSVDDLAYKYPLPDGSGYHTNKGITWRTFQDATPKCGFVPTVELFYAMPEYVWGSIFKLLYWDLIMGDKIQSQAIADTWVDWAWMSGVHTAVRKMQEFLKIQDDGIVGPMTINAINTMYSFGVASQTERDFNNAFSEYRMNWLLSLPGQEANYQGWKNRCVEILKFTDSEITN